MSDQDTPPPPPQDDPTPGQDAPPPMESAPASESITDSIPMDAPSTAGIGLGQGKLPEAEEKTMGMLAHVLGAVTCALGPLIIWLIKKDDSPFVNDQGKEALNFQISAFIVYFVCGVLSIIPYLGCIFALLSMAAWVVVVVFAIKGGMAANNGQVYRYPFALRLIK